MMLFLVLFLMRFLVILLPKVRRILLAVSDRQYAGLDADVATRVGQTTKAHALVRAGGQRPACTAVSRPKNRLGSRQWSERMIRWNPSIIMVLI
ncbi:MAG TPA: hypothetical protein VNQ56_14445 [Pseudolabrys sp.]|nr:hypothetical protein [Pseudolabrys sp.]